MDVSLLSLIAFCLSCFFQFRQWISEFQINENNNNLKNLYHDS